MACPISKQSDGSGKRESYPPNIVRDIATVNSGLELIYYDAYPPSGKKPVQLRRTEFTPQEVKVIPKDVKIQPDQFPRTKFSQYSAQPWYSHNSSTQAVFSEWKTVNRSLIKNDHWKPISQNNGGFLSAIVPKLEALQAWKFPYVSTPEWPQAWGFGYVQYAECTCPDDCWNTTHKHPVFTCPPSAHLGRLFVEKKITYGPWHKTRLVPHDEREMEWLRAFLRVVTYLQAAEKKDKELSQALEGKCQISDGA